MDALECIYTRRSVRKYAKKKISEETLEKIMKAAMSGPSAMNQQPWHFVVVKDRKLLAELPKVNPYAQMAVEADLAIIVCGDPKLEKLNGFLDQDCCIAAQNIVLAAHSLGLGTVWTAAHPFQDRIKKLRTIFKMPENVIPLCVIPIGYPAETPAPVEKYKADRVHYDVW